MIKGYAWQYTYNNFKACNLKKWALYLENAFLYTDAIAYIVGVNTTITKRMQGDKASKIYRAVDNLYKLILVVNKLTDISDGVGAFCRITSELTATAETPRYSYRRVGQRMPASHGGCGSRNNLPQFARCRYGGGIPESDECIGPTSNLLVWKLELHYDHSIW